MRTDADYVLCECDLTSLRAIVSEMESTNTVAILKSPSVCLAMIPAEDSLEKQKFFLGEALMTDCEVLVNGEPGFGLCMGDEPTRAYCIAFIDALLHRANGAPVEVDVFLEKHAAALERARREEFNLILTSQVDFKLMEEE